MGPKWRRAAARASAGAGARGGGSGGSGAGALVSGGEGGGVGGHFRVEFGVGAASAEDARKEDAEGGHGSLSSRRAIMAPGRGPVLVSAASCLRPARVME